MISIIRQQATNNVVALGSPITVRRKRTVIIQPASYSYIAPATAAPPASGEIQQGTNLINKLAMSHTDLNARDLTSLINSLTTGDFVSIKDMVYSVTAPTVDAGTYSTISIDPPTQLQPGIYPVRAWRP